MSLKAYLTSQPYTTTYPDHNGGSIEQADLFVYIYNSETGQPANANNGEVTFSVNTNGSIETVTASVSGQSIPIYPGYYRELRYNDQGELTYDYSVTVTLLSFTAGTDVITPSPCSLLITQVKINAAETAPGARDGEATIFATSNYNGITYSTDDVNYQPSPTFSGLNGGLKTFYALDANGCKASATIEIPVISNLLTDDPSVTLPDGNISRWNAAFNPVVFTYQRKDFEVLEAMPDTTSPGNTIFRINTLLSNTAGVAYLKENDKVYINAAPYKGIYVVKGLTSSGYLVISTPFISNAGGYININQIRGYYKIITRITYQDKFTGTAQTIESTNRPDSSGIVKADLSNFLQSLLAAKDESDYTLGNYRDDNLSASYSIAYAEEWDEDGLIKRSAFIPVNQQYYVLYSAKQLGERYGGNLAAYLPFANLADGLPKAKWITDFAEPAYSNGYPFDIGFIYSESLLGHDIYCEFTLLDINRNPLPGGPQTSYLLNENGSWLTNTDGSKLIISRQSSGNIALPQRIGLNRLLIDSLLAGDVYYIDLTLKYAEGNTIHSITQTQTIRVDDAIDDNSVYLRWIGLTGSWNYYRFGYNQEVSLDVQNAVIVKNYVNDWENQQGIEEVISKTAGQKIKVVAEDLSVADIKGLQSIKYSPKVQMLVGKNPVKWQTIVINSATFSEYETRNGQAPFSVTFNMPAINIQRQ
ncbi:hypothetical protein A0256_22065 [Mucilaginibacter sp. PAMC 26640]|nr:hypothetical protein A0256_22065 [Mucilaginibacter sp. PAMC 26640]